jgi:hypothetical protein
MMQRKYEYVNYVAMVLCFGLLFWLVLKEGKKGRVRNGRVDLGGRE